MKISVDFAAIEAKGYFGTKIFAINLKQAVEKYDQKNNYIFYDFKNAKPKIFWNKIALSIAELKYQSNIFLALNQSIPLYVSGKIISFSHGLSFYFYPKNYHYINLIRLNNQLKEMIKRSEKIVVSSIKIKKEFKKIFPQFDQRKIVVIPFGIPFDILDNKPNFKREKFFLVVGGDQSIKNYSFIKKIFYQFKKENDDFRLINVNQISRKKLINYYQKATALLTASFYESFNLPVLEALTLGCPVIGLNSAIIPELKDYVNLAKNEKQFLNLMKKIPKKPDRKMIKKLKIKFSWKNYINELIKLYIC